MTVFLRIVRLLAYLLFLVLPCVTLATTALDLIVFHGSAASAYESPALHLLDEGLWNYVLVLPVFGGMAMVHQMLLLLLWRRPGGVRRRAVIVSSAIITAPWILHLLALLAAPRGASVLSAFPSLLTPVLCLLAYVPRCVRNWAAARS